MVKILKRGSNFVKNEGYITLKYSLKYDRELIQKILDMIHNDIALDPDPEDLPEITDVE